MPEYPKLYSVKVKALEFPIITENETEAIEQAAETLYEWKPSDFDYKVIKTQDPDLEKYKGYVIASYSGYDVYVFDPHPDSQFHTSPIEVYSDIETAKEEIDSGAIRVKPLAELREKEINPELLTDLWQRKWFF